MATTQPVDAAEPFGERVETLFDELALAVQYDRPAILLAVYASEFVRADAEAALTGKLHALGQTVVPYRVTGEADADIARHLAEREDRGGAIYFVSGLRWGGGRDGALAYRSLNLRREYFGEYRIRAVFWLTEREAAALPRHAPDFWVFRHRVVEFVERPTPEQAAPLARELAWQGWDNLTLREDTAAKIALREALLADLPAGTETLAARGELLYTLAGLRWANRDYDVAIDAFRQTIEIAEQLGDTRLASWSFNGLGNVYADLGRTDDAIAAYRQAIALDSNVATAHSSLAACYRKQGQEAEYQAEIQAARRLMAAESEYNRACFEAILGHTEEALALLEAALAKHQVSAAWAARDPDFESLWDDPRFLELIERTKKKNYSTCACEGTTPRPTTSRQPKG